MTQALQAHEVDQLGREGWFVRKDWLTRQVSRDARVALEGLAGFAPAQVGRGLDRREERSVRGDELRWLDREGGPANLEPVFLAFECLKDELNLQAFLGLSRLELQGSRYLRAGAHYERHLDSFRGRRGRRLTCIYYLNEGWLPAHGGCLRLQVSPLAVDIAPCLNSLVVFLSETVEHEVLPSYADRWAVTAWWSGV